jgi:glycosyltransferase involved in cell wall biosynthesis
MTAPSPGALQRPPAFGERERLQALRAQEACAEPGSVAVTCSAEPGAGGLGRHLSEILEAYERAGAPTACISGATRAREPARLRGAWRAGALNARIAQLPLPLSPGVRARSFAVGFDSYAARRLPHCEQLVAFNGQALAQLRTARRRGTRTLGLVSANSHLRRLAEQHARAFARYPFERSWAAHLLRRNLAEYDTADRILVATDYIRDSFLEHGVPEERLVRFPLTPDPRFAPSAAPAKASDEFELVYVGSLAVHKGVPLLLEAFRALPHRDLRLRLVGSWGSRGMKRCVLQACAADRRIGVFPGDPLPWLRAARLCVHPAYEDGFGYAPAEALACGLPTIVSEDTGMKELIGSPQAGLVLPTGDLDALTGALEAAYRGEILAA